MAGEQVDLRVQLTAVLPMICSGLGLPMPPAIQGSLPSEIAHRIITETCPPQGISSDGYWRAIIEADFKFLWNEKGDNQLFNLREDPKESLNLADLRPGLAAELLRELEAHLEGLPEPGDAGLPVRVDEETSKALRELGYIE